MTASPEFRARLNAVFASLERHKLAAALLDRRNDQFYLTGYTGSDSWLLLLTKPRQAVILTDSRYQEEAETTAPDADTVLWKTSPAHHVAALLKKHRIRSLAITPGSLTVGFYQALEAEAPGLRKFYNLEPDIAALRAVKSKAEIACLRAALKCAQTAFAECRTRWKPGMTEADVKNDLDYEMKRRGAQATGFDTIVAVAANASLPHAHAGRRKIRRGAMLLIDFGAEVNRYTSDLTRTLWCGDMPKVWRARYRAVLEAQQAGIEAIGPGVAGAVADAAARQALASHGIADKFTHGLGHGVGLAVHEEPRLNAKNGQPLAVGNVVTVEPGVYFPGAGGIRTEDMVLVTARGREVLSSLPKDEESAVF